MANQSLNGISFLNSNRQLFRSNESLSKSATNLTTLLNTNTEAEDSEKLAGNDQIRSKVTNIKQSIESNAKAIGTIGAAEEGLQKINSFLQSARKLVIESSKTNNNSDLKNNLQLNIDNIIQSIDQIALSTAYDDKNLLNGDAKLTDSFKPPSIAKIDIFNAQFKNNLDTDIPFSITALPDYAKINLSFDKNQITQPTDLTISGPIGSQDFSFPEKSSLLDISTSINNKKLNTGVNAYSFQNSLLLSSLEVGSQISISVTDKNNSGFLGGASPQFQTINSSLGAFGQDVQGTINGVNGQGIGQTLQVNTPQFSGKLTFEAQSNSINSTPSDINDLIDEINNKSQNNFFSIKNSGRLFENNDSIFPINNSVGIENFSSNQLGNDFGKLSSLADKGENFAIDNPKTAISIIDDSITSVNLTRARIFQFQKNNLEPNESNLRVSLENIIASESRIRDLDFATKTASFTKSQILIQSNSSISAQANTSTGSVIDLLK